MKKSRRNYNYRSFCKSTGLLFALLLILVLILNLLLPDRGFSPRENRVLASSPELSLSQVLSGKYETKYETYVNDQFLLRDFWVTTKATADYLLGRREENGVYLGKDRYLMEAFQPAGQDRIDATTDAVTAFAKKHSDLNHYSLVVPTAVNILQSKLPAHAPVQNQNSYLDSLKTSLSEAGITSIDVRKTLSEHDNETLYYHTDHHWTTLGAYYAYHEAAEVMNLDHTRVSFHSEPVSYSFQGTLSAKSGFCSADKEELDVYFPDESVPSSVVNYVDEQKKTASFYDTSHLKERDKYALFFDGNHAQIKISTPVDSDRSLLVLKDSYANCFVPFLTPYYRTIIMIDPRYYYGDLEQLIQVENIQDVLYLYNANTFFTDTSLNIVLTS